MEVKECSTGSAPLEWPRLLAALAESGGFDALLVLELDAERASVAAASAPHESLVGLTVPTSSTPWSDLSVTEPALCRGIRKRFPDDAALRELGAESAVAVALERSDAGRQILVATSGARWRKPAPRLDKLRAIAPLVSASIASQAGLGLDRVVRAFGAAGPTAGSLEPALRALVATVGARYGLIATTVPDEDTLGQPVAFVDATGEGAAVASLPALPLAALRGRWNGHAPAPAAWLPGRRVSAASGRELRSPAGKLLGCVAVYHDAPLAWTPTRERSQDVFAALAAAHLGMLAPRALAGPEWSLPAPDRGGVLTGDLGPRVFAFDTAVESLAELLRPGLPDDVTLSVHAEAELALIKVDPVRFQRCLRDVIRAALELPGVRHVRVLARHRRLGSADEVDALARPKAGGRNPAGYASILVAAEGQGLDEHTELAMLAENAMGLFAHEERGYLLARREGGSSRTLEVLLPTAKALAVFRPKHADPRAPVESVAHRRPLVLVVDDEEGVRKTLTRLLGSAGARVEVVPGGLEALDTVRRMGDELDLVFLDIRMPAMGGVATLRAVRAAAPDLPIVLMSGYAPTGEERRKLAEMSDAFLSKPFSLDEVRRLVSELAGRRTTPASARPQA